MSGFHPSLQSLFPFLTMAILGRTDKLYAEEPPSSGTQPSLTLPSGDFQRDSTHSSTPLPSKKQTMDLQIDPNQDKEKLRAQGKEPKGFEKLETNPFDIFSEDWWGNARPIFEFHGYFRVRTEYLNNFSLGRHDSPGDPNNPNLWPQPLDNSYEQTSGNERAVALCDPDNASCHTPVQWGANMRFRINPELHISDNLRILSQIDALDNLVLGSTPDTRISRARLSPQEQQRVNPYASQTWQVSTQGPPLSRSSIDVKRMWAEYVSPIGQLRFGRMPFHWGLGMIYNAGDGVDSDWQTTYDRIQFISAIKPLDLYGGLSWDFMDAGAIYGSPYDVYGGIPYDTSRLDNVNQTSFFIAKKQGPELQRLALAKGKLVTNAGLMFLYRNQFLSYPIIPPGPSSPNNGLERVGAYWLNPDVWLQLLWQKLRFEAEFTTLWGSVEKTPDLEDRNNPVKIRQWGLATQTEFRAMEEKLRLNFGFGWASGDPWARTLNPSSSGWQGPLNDGRGPLSTFRFHPDYRVDLIFFRRILSRIEGAYYFRPSIDYDFMRHPDGQKLGGGAAFIWSRASEFVQTPGHKRDLGAELDFQFYYQSKDGSLNDDPNKIGGFYGLLQAGLFFPLGGLGYLPLEQTSNLSNWDTSNAYTLRLFLGVVY
ncbi:hypothetical protein BCY86_03315 [Pajaroellobacter abortibovis]|uniref:TIGR04551 family protein n=2 Tax=Pajaroellobacter abortibovis TaxID=1882918 RepID=A0A1L6MW85_9BACT|nr:hypothetical protein BCY86_03315 [Pajaroellobacter abortibovis]